MQRDAIVFRTPGCNHWIQHKYFHFLYLDRHMKFTTTHDPNKKHHTQELATKNYSNQKKPLHFVELVVLMPRVLW